MVYTSVATYVRKQESRLKAGLAGIESATELLATMGKEDMEEQTQGPLKTKTLRQMGHPYARNNVAVQGAARGITSKRKFQSSLKGQIKKTGMVQRLPINLQSGAVHRGIQMKKRGFGLGRYSYYVFSSAPHAKYVLAVKGTDRMVPRGLKGPNGLMRKRHKLRRHVLVTHLTRAHAA